MTLLSERARVLITVKASPEPSKTYGDTVCIAGARLRDDGSAEWVRIYPVAFRHLASDQQFRKFEVIEVDLTPSTKDARPESHRPNWDTLTRTSSSPHDGPSRARVLEPLIGPTMCDLRAAVEADRNAQSLGLVEVRELKGLAFEEHGPWTPDQEAGMRAVFGQPDLLGTVDQTPVLLPPRFKVRYRYRCASEHCSGHEPRILDWELNALQHHNRRLSDSDLKALITRKFFDDMWKPDLRTCFFVGNFADMLKRRSFSVLGVYRTPRQAQWASTLF